MRKDNTRPAAASVRGNLAAEDRARVCLVQLLCTVSALRQGLMQGSWWTLLLSLLPGLFAALLAFVALRLWGAGTLTELLRNLLGRAGGWMLSIVLGALLMLEAGGSLAALITLFTDGVGSRGTPLTLALLTSGALALCLWGDGLARGALLLRWPLLAGCAVALAAMAPRWRVDHLFPLPGMEAAREVLRGGFTAGWPLLLLLTIPEGERPARQLARVAAPVGGAVTALLAVNLTLPQEALPALPTLAQRLMLPWRFVPPPVQLLMLCLLLTGLFLAIAAGVQLCGEHLCAPWGRRPAWLTWALLVALVTMQAASAQPVMTAAQRVLVLLTCAACVMLLPLAAFRRWRK